MILMIDDEERWIEEYISELKADGFSVNLITNVDEIDNYIKNNETGSGIELIILDIMMAPGEKYSDKQSKLGVVTGALVLKDLKTKWSNIPILILTNKTIDTEMESLSSLYCAYKLKEDTDATVLPEIVRNLKNTI